MLPNNSLGSFLESLVEQSSFTPRLLLFPVGRGTNKHRPLYVVGSSFIMIYNDPWESLRTNKY